VCVRLRSCPTCGAEVEPLFSAPDWSPGRLSEELSASNLTGLRAIHLKPKTLPLAAQGPPSEPLNSALERQGAASPSLLNCALERLARTYGLCLSKYEYELPIKESF
ncbi:unnamed protein product, partial [Pleuronectes platessa]